jgi:hypothetical protein
VVALVEGVNVLLGEGPGNIGPCSEFATLIYTLESLKVSQCPVFPILYAVVFVSMPVQFCGGQNPQFFLEKTLF